jgi:hypothetical protein
MVATRIEDRQIAQPVSDAKAVSDARASRLKRGELGAKNWTISETVPGTFRVFSSNGGDYAVWYYQETDRWSCSCPDFSEESGIAHKLGIECKHIFGVKARHDLVHPETQIPFNLMRQDEGAEKVPPQIHSHEEDPNMVCGSFTREISKALIAPFPIMAHLFRPGAMSGDGSRALALTYVDSRLYQSRLDEVDPAWQSEYDVITLDDRILVNCRLSVCGVTREDVGECRLFTVSHGATVPEENAYTSAVAQAFKRVCAQFGLGRYLYEIRKLWAEYDQQKRCFTSDGLARLRRALIGSIAEIDAAHSAQPTKPIEPRRAAENHKASNEQRDSIRRMLTELGYEDRTAQNSALAQAGFSQLEELTTERASQAIARLAVATKNKDGAREAAAARNGRS